MGRTITRFGAQSALSVGGRWRRPSVRPTRSSSPVIVMMPVSAARMPVVMGASVPVVVATGMPTVVASPVPAVAAIPVVAGMHAAMGTRMPVVVAAAVPIVSAIFAVSQSGARKRRGDETGSGHEAGSHQHSPEESTHGISPCCGVAMRLSQVGYERHLNGDLCTSRRRAPSQIVSVTSRDQRPRLKCAEPPPPCSAAVSARPFSVIEIDPVMPYSVL